MPDMTPEQSKRIEQLSANMNTRCVGRYLIDLPNSFVFAWNPGAGVEGVDIVVTPMSESQFKYFLSSREAELRTQTYYNDGNPDHSLQRMLFKEIVKQNVVAHGVVFGRAKKLSTAYSPTKIYELVAWKDGFLVHMQIEAWDTSSPEHSNDPAWRDLPSDAPQKLAHLLKVYERVDGLPEGYVPTEPGLCIPNGFVAGPAVEEEALTITYRLKDSPDVYFTFQEQGDLHEDDSLLERTSQIEREMKPSGTQTLRKGVRKISDQSYEEWLMKGPTPDEVEGTMFMLHGNEVAEGADKPFITLEMFNGFRVMQSPDISEEMKERLGLYKALPRATLSEVEAVALWDKVSATLRPRSGAF
jgi:hypothetical protein